MSNFLVTRTIRLGAVKYPDELVPRIKEIIRQVRPFFADGVKDATEYLQLCADLGMSIHGDHDDVVRIALIDYASERMANEPAQEEQPRPWLRAKKGRKGGKP